MDTWIVGLKNKVKAPLQAGILGHFTGSLLVFEVIGEISNDTVKRLVEDIERDELDNIVITLNNVSRLKLDNLLSKDKEILLRAIRRLNEFTEIVIVRKK